MIVTVSTLAEVLMRNSVQYCHFNLRGVTLGSLFWTNMNVLLMQIACYRAL